MNPNEFSDRCQAVFGTLMSYLSEEILILDEQKIKGCYLEQSLGMLSQMMMSSYMMHVLLTKVIDNPDISLPESLAETIKSILAVSRIPDFDKMIFNFKPGGCVSCDCELSQKDIWNNKCPTCGVVLYHKNNSVFNKSGE
jgi:predicted RNA-binding Zn-ribbon protein involved in translation (DUF1610 family)